jgi:hypothetical protein
LGIAWRRRDRRTLLDAEITSTVEDSGRVRGGFGGHCGLVLECRGVGDRDKDGEMSGEVEMLISVENVLLS